jgi:hypothetical protein
MNYRDTQQNSSKNQNNVTAKKNKDSEEKKYQDSSDLGRRGDESRGEQLNKESSSDKKSHTKESKYQPFDERSKEDTSRFRHK